MLAWHGLANVALYIVPRGTVAKQLDKAKAKTSKQTSELANQRISKPNPQRIHAPFHKPSDKQKPPPYATHYI